MPALPHSPPCVKGEQALFPCLPHSLPTNLLLRKIFAGALYKREVAAHRADGRSHLIIGAFLRELSHHAAYAADETEGVIAGLSPPSSKNKGAAARKSRGAPLHSFKDHFMNATNAR